MNYRWIMYIETPIPGGGAINLNRVTSIAKAKAELEEFEGDLYLWGACSARLYPYSEEDWAEAQNFANVGCPFDYPSYIIEHGPRGGLKHYSA